MLLSKSMEAADKGSSDHGHGAQALTDVCDVERKPEEESVADQLCKEQTQGELDHTLRERESLLIPKVYSRCSFTYATEPRIP